MLTTGGGASTPENSCMGEVLQPFGNVDDIVLVIAVVDVMVANDL
jgi:hypothetical protein